MNSGYGMLRAIALSVAGPSFGQIRVVVPSTDASYNRMQEIFKPVDGGVRLYTSLESAYADMTTDADDVTFLAGSGSHNLSAMLTTAKNRCHLIGLSPANGRITAQASRVVLGVTTAATDLAVLKDTGVRNSFINIKFISNNTKDESLYGAIFGGEGGLLQNVSVQKLTDLDEATAADVVWGGDSYTVKDCEFGFDTLDQSAARPTMLWNSTIAGARGKDNYFENLKLKGACTSASKEHIKIANVSSCLFTNEFKDCSFMSLVKATGSCIASTNAVQSVASLVDGVMLFTNPSVFGCTNFCTTLTAGISVHAPASSNNAFEAVTPA